MDNGRDNLKYARVSRPFVARDVALCYQSGDGFSDGALRSSGELLKPLDGRPAAFILFGIVIGKRDQDGLLRASPVRANQMPI